MLIAVAGQQAGVTQAQGFPGFPITLHQNQAGGRRVEVFWNIKPFRSYLEVAYQELDEPCKNFGQWKVKARQLQQVGMRLGNKPCRVSCAAKKILSIYASHTIKHPGRANVPGRCREIPSRPR